jgi:5-methylcytosine-specific restriction endonuclease McrA
MTRPYIPQPLRRLVAERARGCCEYCLLHQDDSPDTHQIDHIVAVRHGGQTVEDNLAYACAECNHHKGVDFATLDRAVAALSGSTTHALRRGATTSPREAHGSRA